MAKIQKIYIENLVSYPHNVRLKTDGKELVNGLADRGLDVPLRVSKKAEDLFWVLCGNRRLDGLLTLASVNEAAFSKHFSKGIPCEVFENLTPEEELNIMADHGDSQRLSSLFEFYLLAKAKWAFHPGYTETQILDFIGSALPVTGKAAIEIKELSAKVDGAGSAIEKATFLIERQKRMLSAHKGKLQVWNAIRRMPDVVEALYRMTLTGEKPAGIPEEYLARITQKESDRLYMVWSELVINEGAIKDRVLDQLPDRFTEEIREIAKSQLVGTVTIPFAKVGKFLHETDPEAFEMLLAKSEAAKAAAKAAKK